jgi:hypothetical protein
MIDAMKLALESLEYHQEQTRPIHKTQETIITLRQAIAEAEKEAVLQEISDIGQWDTSDMAHRSGGLSVEQEKLCKYCGGIGQVVCDGRCMPEQEPVAWMYKNGIYMSDPSNSVSPEFLITPLYTAPPKREWVGLTDEEIEGIAKRLVDDKTYCSLHFAVAIQSKLKERNT